MIPARHALIPSLLVTAAALAAQPAAPPHFEIASVKLAANQDILSTRPERSIGRFHWITQMSYLLSYAWHMQPWRILGEGPHDDIYEVDAKVDPKATDDQVRLMLQSLLIDRFRMKFRLDPRDAEGYALSVAKGGPKMTEAKEGEIPPLPEWLRDRSNPPAMETFVATLGLDNHLSGIVGRRVSMFDLTEKLQRHLETSVFDQTNLPGKYYFAFRFTDSPAADVPFPDLFAAIRELGLRLEKHKGPVDMLVIDSMEKLPTEN